MIDPYFLERELGDRWYYKASPICRQCGYDLTGNESKRCPECGTEFTFKELAEYVEQVRIDVRELELVNLWFRSAFRCGAAGVALLVAGLVFAGQGAFRLEKAAQALAFLCGLAGPLVCSGLMLVYRLPEWARQPARQCLDYDKAAAAAIVGAAVMCAALIFLLT